MAKAMRTHFKPLKLFALLLTFAIILSVMPTLVVHAADYSITVKVNDTTYGDASSTYAYLTPGAPVTSAPSTAWVGLNTAPRNGGIFRGWVVSSANSGNITIFDSDSMTSAYFQMPTSGDVVITAMFEPDTAEKEYTITTIVSDPVYGDSTLTYASHTRAKAGTTINLTAAPMNGGDFQEWYIYPDIGIPNNFWINNRESASAASFVMPSCDVTLVAVFSQGHQGASEYTITTFINDPMYGNSATTGADLVRAKPGTRVYLTANPTNGGVFDKWEEDPFSLPGLLIFNANSMSAAYFYMPSKDVTLRANFTQGQGALEYTINTSVNNPEYGDISGTKASLARAKPGTTVTLTAKPVEGATFVRWEVVSGIAQISNPTSMSAANFIMPSSDVTLRAVFLPSAYKITVTAGTGGIAYGDGPYAPGTTVALSATPDSGYIFDGWYENGSRVSTASSYKFTATANRTLEARFVQAQSANTYSVSVISNNTEWGTAFANTSVATQGNTVHLTANPVNGYALDYWEVVSGNAYVYDVTSLNTLFVMPSGSVTVRAVFKPLVTYLITATASMGGAVSGGNRYATGAQVVLYATPYSGYTFDGWYESGVVVSTNPTYSFAAASDRTLQAVFQSVQTQTTGQTSSIPNKHSTWAEPELLKAIEMGLIPDSLKDPNIDYTKPITRVEFAGIVVRTYELLSNATAMPELRIPFIDTKDEDALKAYNVGLMVGVSSVEFAPNAILTREQSATALTRAFKRASFSGWSFATDPAYPLSFTQPALFDDDMYISDWARESVYFMAANGIIQGIGNNLFAPRASASVEESVGYATTTREQALSIALRAVENLS